MYYFSLHTLFRIYEKAHISYFNVKIAHNYAEIFKGSKDKPNSFLRGAVLL